MVIVGNLPGGILYAFGGGSRFLMYKEEEKALEGVNRALDLGITYMDTAYGYGNGLSEERMGKVLKTRRKVVFNSWQRAFSACEGSLTAVRHGTL